MTSYEEQRLKAEAELEYIGQQKAKVPNAGGAIGSAGMLRGLGSTTADAAQQQNLCSRPSISDTAESLRYRAQSSLQEAERLEELSSLLERNPEVKRILEILHLLNY